MFVSCSAAPGGSPESLLASLLTTLLGNTIETERFVSIEGQEEPMTDSSSKVMLGMSFFKNHKDAKRTAWQFCDAIQSSEIRGRVVLGLETGYSAMNVLHESSERLHEWLTELTKTNWPEIYVWDDGCQVLEDWPIELPKPFYPGFSYGGAVNRLLGLAAIAKCNYLVRVDPGTAPHGDFAQVVNRHIGEIASGNLKVVSGQYTDRIALRDDFVKGDQLDEYYDFVCEWTGIDPRSPSDVPPVHLGQVTGGAAFTVAVGGPPVIVFDGAPVWASDDGYFRLEYSGKAGVDRETQVSREEAGGHAREPGEYPVRLVSMVVLNELRKKHSLDVALKKADLFLDRLASLVREDKPFDCEKAKADLRQRSIAIKDGYQNYPELRRRWDPDVLEAMVQRLKRYPYRVKPALSSAQA